MEYTPPFPPTCATRRRQAVRLYIDGEAACDTGSIADGVILMKKAISLAWELDASIWPAWAQHLYIEFQEGGKPPVPPPILGEQLEYSTVAAKFVPHALRSHDGQHRWWEGSAALDAIIHGLATQHFAIVDGLAGAMVARRFRMACNAAWERGERFRPAKVAAPGGGTDGARSALTRSDYIAWVDIATGSDEDGVAKPLNEIVECIDSLVRAIKSRVLGRDAPHTVVTRQRPQVARYGEGDAFARHCDNYCSDGKGPHCNARWLTAVYYTNEGWREQDGGCIRLHQPQGNFTQVDDEKVADRDGVEDPSRGEPVLVEDDAVLDVAPIADRLLLFHSDFRVPHAVLPTHSSTPRYAATCWFNRTSAQQQLLTADDS